jgi:hypothetical protein
MPEKRGGDKRILDALHGLLEKIGHPRRQVFGCKYNNPPAHISSGKSIANLDYPA